MTSALMDIEIIGDSRDIQSRLEAMQGAFDHAKIAGWLVAGVDPILRARTKERFDAEGDEISGKWASLRPATADIRRSQSFPGEHPINVRTGKMKRHLLDSPPRVATHSLGATMWSPGSDGGTKTADKVRTAQLGDPATRTVARPVLGVGPMDLEAVMLSLALHISTNQPGASGGSLQGFMR